MSKYLIWDKKTIDFNNYTDVSIHYDKGYLPSRISKGLIYQTRSLRINLSNFEFNSENRRILKKTSDLLLNSISIPINNKDYSWTIHKLGKDFYSNKFNDITFTANKIKELITDNRKSNFNLLLKYLINNKILGYSICYQNPILFHYSYPFYNYTEFSNNYGMGMILKAIEYSLSNNKKYFYIGSISRKEDIYKLQFKNLEWFDGKQWNSDILKAKEIIASC